MDIARKEYEEAFAAALKNPSGEAVTRLVEASDRMSKVMRYARQNALHREG